MKNEVDRIYPFCNKIAEIWSKVPYLRFGQIMFIISKKLEDENRDIFEIEDNEMLKFIENYFEK